MLIVKQKTILKDNFCEVLKENYVYEKTNFLMTKKNPLWE